MAKYKHTPDFVRGGDRFPVKVEGLDTPLKITVRTADRHTLIGKGDRGGLTYYVAYPTQWHESGTDPEGKRPGCWMIDPSRPWRMVGEPETSRRSKSAAKRQSMTAAEARILDKTVLEFVRRYNQSVHPMWPSVALLRGDIFENHGGIRWARHGVDSPSEAAIALDLHPRTQTAALRSSLARLVRKGALRQGATSGLRGREVKGYFDPEIVR